MKKIKSKKNGVAIKLINVLVQKKIYTPPQVSSFLKDDFILYRSLLSFVSHNTKLRF
jgi:hypothetical protein